MGEIQGELLDRLSETIAIAQERAAELDEMFACEHLAEALMEDLDLIADLAIDLGAMELKTVQSCEEDHGPTEIDVTFRSQGGTEEPRILCLPELPCCCDVEPVYRRAPKE